MENQNTSDKKLNKSLVWICVLVGLFVVLVLLGLAWSIIDDKQDLKEVNSKLSKEQGFKSACLYQRDSLLEEVRQLSFYKALSKAMIHRDEATVLLPHKVGDFAYMKRDSSRVIISDIISGGSKYQYYIKYKVLHKDNTTEEVLPELIY